MDFVMKKGKVILSAAVSLAAVAAIVLLFITIARPSQSAGSGTGEGEGTSGTNIQFTPSNNHEDGFTVVAENASLRLSANMKQGYIRLEDKESGAVWDSSPDGYDTDENLKGAAKVSLGSLLNIKYADRDSNTTTQNARAGVVLKDNLNAEPIANGVRFELYFEKEGFLIPVEITLEETGLKVNVPIQEIEEESDDLKLTGIIPLPNFGAAGAEEEGYFLVPDGSGALIEFNQRGSFAEYSQEIYGRDLAVIDATRKTKTQTARLPVFGMKKGDAAFLAIITEGDARAAVNAAVRSSKSPYNVGNVEFTYRDSATVEVSQKTFESTKVNMFEPARSQLESFTVEYRFLSGGEADYVGMAQAYRRYLAEEEGVEPVETGETTPLTLSLLGGVMRQESVLGIPVNQVAPITSYEDVRTLAQTLLDSGVKDVTFQYLSWGKGGTQNRIPVGLSAEGGLGGMSQLKKTLSLLQENGMEMYLDVNLTDIQKSIWGFNGNYDSAKSVQKEPAIEYQYKMSTFQQDSLGTMTFLLSPRKILEASQRIAAKAQKLEFAGFSAATLSEKMYSDFGDSHVDRGSGEAIWRQAMENLAGAKGALMASEPNAYAFSSATLLTDVPIDTSDFTAQTEAVPFYQIALHGLIPMTTPSVNSFTDERFCVLKAVETGIGLKYTLGMQNIEKLRETDAAGLYYIDAKRWTEQAIDDYKEVSAVISRFAGEEIRNHEKLADGVYRTTFESGAVVVNYTDADVAANGVEVAAQGFAVMGVQ